MQSQQDFNVSNCLADYPCVAQAASRHLMKNMQNIPETPCKCEHE